MSDGHSDAMKNLMATPGIERLKANIEACPDLGVDVEIYVQQRVAAAEQKLADRAENPLMMIDGKVYDTRDVVKLLATDQKYAALAEAVLDAEVIDGGPGMPIKLAMVASKHWRRIKALAQPDQPAGEWITINADGSNLPEHVEGAEWFVQDGTGRSGWTAYSPARWRAAMYRPDRPVPS